MRTTLTRMTFTVTEEMEDPLREFKKEMFYDRSQSEMIRELVLAGIRASKQEKTEKKKGHDRAS